MISIQRETAGQWASEAVGCKGMFSQGKGLLTGETT